MLIKTVCAYKKHLGHEGEFPELEFFFPNKKKIVALESTSFFLKGSYLFIYFIL